MLTAGQFERRIRSAGTVALLAAVVFLCGLVYWQAFRADLGGEDRNPRVLASFANPLRGRILDRDGNELVTSTASGARLYRDASLSHVLGYIDPRYGSQGAELVFNDVLSGEAAAYPIRELVHKVPEISVPFQDIRRSRSNDSTRR